MTCLLIERLEQQFEVQDYGYTWNGMLPIQEDEAVDFFENKNIEVFCLYPDDTESVVENVKDIRKHAEHGGIFGVEKKHWISKC